jgi:glyceraldehyde 3-phosphate dehydrogenase
LAPVAKVLLDNFGIRRGLMTTVHSYTNDQVILDAQHKDLRRARSGATNIIPTTTGAAKAVALVIPELKGKFDGYSLRVPTPTVSLIDFVVETDKPAKVYEVNAAFRKAAESDAMQGILGFSDEPLVSSDYRQDSRSAIVDGKSTMVIDGNLIKVVAWYDNEWGYSCRVADLVALVCEKGFEYGDDDEEDYDEDEADEAIAEAELAAAEPVEAEPVEAEPVEAEVVTANRD